MSTKDLEKEIVILKKKLKEKELTLNECNKTLLYFQNKVKDISDDLEKEISIIRNIHKNLIPTNLPSIPHFEFSYKFISTKLGISGDFFDVIPLEDPAKFGILLSSSKTYSIFSVFFSSIVKNSKEFKQCRDLKESISYLASTINLDKNSNAEMDIFYGIVDRRNFILDYFLAGDIFFAHKVFGKKTISLKSIFKKLHFDSDKKFVSEKIHLQPKDMLILCSSGLAKQENVKKEKFGAKRLLDIISNSKQGVLELRQNILFQGMQFSEGSDSYRDRTILIGEVKDRILKLKF